MYRIVIADDSIYMRETLRELLHAAGYEVIGEAVSGANAIELFKALLPDIVMLDMAMPGENSIETLKTILEIKKDAAVIMLSVVGKPEQILEALNCGATGYVTKPFDEASVQSAVKKASFATRT